MSVIYGTVSELGGRGDFRSPGKTASLTILPGTELPCTPFKGLGATESSVT